jgi:chromatin remodeling complex protein RSC6
VCCSSHKADASVSDLANEILNSSLQAIGESTVMKSKNRKFPATTYTKHVCVKNKMLHMGSEEDAPSGVNSLITAQLHHKSKISTNRSQERNL